ncbi:MAG: hypothetical protein HYR62_09220 [Actinobacteria bacterium]|nr:hypothetical protein [Actinomycetota bacterium]MBI3688062.1 hypothetical protein [Actinomycetota bacterium]
MTILQTVVVYVGIPAAALAALAAVILLPGRRRSARYRPGRSWDFAPVWYRPVTDPVTSRGEPAPGGPAPVSAVGGGAHGSW